MKKLFSALILITLLTTSVSGCGENGSSAQESVAQATSEDMAYTQADVENSKKYLEIKDNCVYDCKDGAVKIVIPEGVTTIMPNAFANLASLSTVIIPDSVQAINSDAFRNCASISKIIYKGKVYNNDNLKDLYKAING